MPEGHTLHRLARDMAELVGQVVAASSPQGRLDPAPVDGQRVVGVEAYGKHLLVDTAASVSVHVHLAMRGTWLRFSPVTGAAMRQVRLRLATPEVAWDLIAPGTCELVDPAGRAAVVAGLGPDPLRGDADPARVSSRLAADSRPVGVALMDQRVLAGVGNVFRAEALHACGIAPGRPARDVGPDEFDRLWATLRSMMATAVDDGRIVTVDAEDRLAVPDAAARRVYKQATCHDCGTAVATATLDGRTAYWCPTCQPR